MKTKAWNLIVVTVIALMGVEASALKLKGYDQTDKVKPVVLKASVERFKETDREFLIVFSGRAALYHFPKTKDLALRAREFLNESKTLKKKLVATIDPKTAKILFLESAPGK